MTRKQIQLGATYWHKMDGKVWEVRVTSVEYDRSRQRHLWNGEYLDNGKWSAPCWGWISELTPKAA